MIRSYTTANQCQYVSTVILNVNICLAILIIAFVNCKGHSSNHYIWNDSERLSPAVLNLCVWCKLNAYWSNEQLIVLIFLHYKQWDWPCQHAGQVMNTHQCLATNKAFATDLMEAVRSVCFWSDSKKMHENMLLNNWL